MAEFIISNAKEVQVAIGRKKASVEREVAKTIEKTAKDVAVENKAQYIGVEYLEQ